MQAGNEHGLGERYGSTSRSTRRLLGLLGALLGLAALGWLAWVIWFQSTPDVQSTMRSYEVTGPHSATARVVVHTRSANVRANCTLRAFGEDHTVVGERNFQVTGLTGAEHRQVDLRTERQATSVELVGCTSERQRRPR